MRKAEVALLLGALALSGCSVAKVPVKAAGTVAGVTLKTAGTAVLVVTKDEIALP